ncbi:hypothetical protein COT72_01950 [archaeon CG10_big_fil_rev_8_21_14_0_10_43_11]|nr:MAG: hypothetical protein COT72_01950 [archaeon CG10_big_fil_rev_8_21_14_0_10_43_11]
MGIICLSMMNRKGITPIIAIVLLLMITVAVAGSVNFWLSNVQRSTQSGVEESTTQISQSAQNRVDIRFKRCESTTIEPFSTDITVNIHNVGTQPIRGGTVSLTLRDEDGTDLAYKENSEVVDFTESDLLAVGDSISVTWTIEEATDGLYLTVSETYGLHITLPSGTATDTTCVAQAAT